VPLRLLLVPAVGLQTGIPHLGQLVASAQKNPARLLGSRLAWKGATLAGAAGRPLAAARKQEAAKEHCPLVSPGGPDARPSAPKSPEAPPSPIFRFAFTSREPGSWPCTAPRGKQSTAKTLCPRALLLIKTNGLIRPNKPLTPLTTSKHQLETTTLLVISEGKLKKKSNDLFLKYSQKHSPSHLEV